MYLLTMEYILWKDEFYITVSGFKYKYLNER